MSANWACIAVGLLLIVVGVGQLFTVPNSPKLPPPPSPPFFVVLDDGTEILLDCTTVECAVNQAVALVPKDIGGTVNMTDTHHIGVSPNEAQWAEEFKRAAQQTCEGSEP